MKKIKIIEKNGRTAKGQLEDGTIVWFTSTNSTWYDFAIATRNVGDEFQANVKISDKGNAYVDRLTADKFLQELTIQTAVAKRDLILRQAALDI
jgi:hypothetical protein